MAGLGVDEPALAKYLAVVDVCLLEIAAGVVELGAVRPRSDAAFKIPADQRPIGMDADLQPEAAAVAAAHGMSLAVLVRELVARVAARDAETLAWLDEARR